MDKEDLQEQQDDNNLQDEAVSCCDTKTNQDNENSECDGSENSFNDELRIKELEEKYLRAYADFENTKKRMERDKYQALEYANEAILRDFLPILDTLESALNGINEVADSTQSVEKIKEGILLTIDNFLKAFSKNGVELIDTSGEFNPNLHNAIMHVRDENKEDGEISQVLQKGYKYKERVIRPSMVSITKNN